VAAVGERGQELERVARGLDVVDHLLAPVRLDAVELHAAGTDGVERAARIAFTEEHLPRRRLHHLRPLRHPRQQVRR
jgi:hypothetical protein